MYFLYRILTAAGIFVLAPYFALRGWKRGEASRGVRERLGSLPEGIAARAAVSPGSIWVHAVSVGEVLAAIPLVEGMKRRFPNQAIFISTGTETGRRLARERLGSADGVFYFPLDWIVPVRRALRVIRPVMIVIVETEIWPNFLRESRRMRIPVVFANARVSERSFAQFSRWKFAIGEFYKRTLDDAQLFLAQSSDDAVRLIEMGALDSRVEVTGNLKYDGEPPAATDFVTWLDAQIRAQERWPVLIAGSVVAEEEQSVLEAYDLAQRQWRHALLILAPRKPDRFDAAGGIAAAGGWKVVRRSRLDTSEPLDENSDVLLLDSIGELAALYSLADAVFVGGSLVPAGGHNILEPAWFGRPPVFGPSMENFREMADQFLAAHAGIQITSGTQLGKTWVQLIADDKARERMGKAAREITRQHRGATARSLDRIAAILEAKGFRS